MSRSVAKLLDTDSFSSLGCCNYPPNVIDRVSNVRNFICGGRPVARIGDVLSPVPGIWTCGGSGTCILPRTITPTSPTRVIAGGRPVARIGDNTNIPSGRVITSGFSRVLIP